MKTTMTDTSTGERRSNSKSTDQLNDSTLFTFGIRLGSVHLLLDAACVSEVLALEPVTRVPNAPPHIVGLAPHGEGALAIIDLGQFLQLEDLHPERYSVDMSSYRVVVVAHSNMEAGLLCDQAFGVIAFERARVEAPGVLKGGRLCDFVREEVDCAEARYGVLDLALVLDSAKLSSARSN